MATYFQINLRGGSTRVIATTEEVANELRTLNSKFLSYGSCPCNKAARLQTRAKMQALLLGAGVVKCQPEHTPATLQVTSLHGVWDLASD